MHNVLERNKIKHIYHVYKDYARFYIPKKFAKIIVKNWGMHNLKHLSKFEVFEKFGVFIPYSSTEERLSLLVGKISVGELNNISNLRKIKIKEQRSRADSNCRPSDFYDLRKR